LVAVRWRHNPVVQANPEPFSLVQFQSAAVRTSRVFSAAPYFVLVLCDFVCA